MVKERSLLFAYSISSITESKRIYWEQIETWKPDQGLIWVHLNYQALKSQHWIKRHCDLDSLTSQALLAQDPRPRCVLTRKGLYLSLRGVNLNEGQNSEDMVSLRIWVESNRIITTQRRNLASIGDLKQALERGHGPKSIGEFLILLNNRLLDRIGEVIDSIQEQVDELEERIISAEHTPLRTQVADVRRKAIMLRRYLAPQREALYQLILEKTDFISDSERMSLRESNDRIIRFIEDLDEVRERATITQEELNNKLSEQLNHRMYILSLVAALFLPGSFITGLLGVNVEGIPGAKNAWGFLIVSSMLLMMFMMILFLFRRKKWL